jgi:hypothetical protein
VGLCGKGGVGAGGVCGQGIGCLGGSLKHGLAREAGPAEVRVDRGERRQSGSSVCFGVLERGWYIMCDLVAAGVAYAWVSVRYACELLCFSYCLTLCHTPSHTLPQE